MTLAWFMICINIPHIFVKKIHEIAKEGENTKGTLSEESSFDRIIY